MKAPANRGTFIQRSRAVSPEQKALYHQVLGAGKSRVKREFFGVSDADLAAIKSRLEAGVARNVRAFGQTASRG